MADATKIKFAEEDVYPLIGRLVGQFIADLTVSGRQLLSATRDEGVNDTEYTFVVTKMEALPKKPKRYVLPMDGTSAWGDDGKHKYAYVIGRSSAGAEWGVTNEPHASDVPMPIVSEADYNTAPAWVKAITPVEVKD